MIFRAAKLFALLDALLTCGALLVAQQTQIPAPTSPGRAVQTAARETARNLAQTGGVDILTDTQGVDFGPYLQDCLSKVRTNWYSLIPESDQLKKGRLAIEFSVLKDGRLANMKLASTAGDASLDRAAWGGITLSAPFPALPSAFNGPYLSLRVRFLYNPEKAGLEKDGSSSKLADPVVHAMLPQNVIDTSLPDYPREARKNKIEGIVKLQAQIDPQGGVAKVQPLEGNPVLAEAAARAVRKWRFAPAHIEGKPIEDQVRINVLFFLPGEYVRAQIVRPELASSSSLPR